MRVLLKLIDAVLSLFFIVSAISTPLVDSQAIFPRHLFPQFLVDHSQKFIHDYDHYLLLEKPNFYVGIICLVLFFIWPLCLLNLYGLLASKSWYPTTCLMFGVSFSTSVVSIVFELEGSGKASDKLKTMYYSLLGVGILATLRGLLARPARAVSAIAKKKA